MTGVQQFIHLPYDLLSGTEGLLGQHLLMITRISSKTDEKRITHHKAGGDLYRVAFGFVYFRPSFRVMLKIAMG